MSEAPSTAPPPEGRTLKQTLINWALLFFIVLPILVGLFSDLAVCPSARLFNIPCPGCGLTRSTLAFLSGDIALAYRYHPLFAILVPFHAAILGYAAWLLVGPKRRAAPKTPLSVWGKRVGVLYLFIIVLMLVVWVSRFFGAFGGPVPV